MGLNFTKDSISREEAVNTIVKLFSNAKQQFNNIGDLKDGILLKTKQKISEALVGLRTDSFKKPIANTLIGATIFTAAFSTVDSLNNAYAAETHHKPKTHSSQGKYTPSEDSKEKLGVLKTKSKNKKKGTKKTIVKKPVVKKPTVKKPVAKKPPVNGQKPDNKIVIEKGTYVIADLDTGITKNVNKIKYFNDRLILTPDCYDVSKSDEAGHGTGTASTILKELDAHPEYKDKIKLMPIRIKSWEPEDIAAGIKYAVDNGAKVINCSFGYQDVQGFMDEKLFNELYNAFQYASKKNVVVVASSGNSGHNFPVSYPAMFPNVISVGALDHEGVPTYFTSCDDGVDFAALGQKVKILDLDGRWVDADGTSFSAPKVAADFIMKYAQADREKEYVTFAKLKEAFANTAIDIDMPGRDVKTGWGLINLEATMSNPLPQGRDIEAPNVVLYNFEDLGAGLNRITFKAIDESNIDYESAKVSLAGTYDNGAKIEERELKYTVENGKYTVDLANLPDGKYIVKISGITDEFGNTLQGTRRFFIRDTKPVKADIKYSIVESDNGFDNNILLNIDASDEFGIGSIGIFTGMNASAIVNFDPTAHEKNVSAVFEIGSERFAKGENIMSVMLDDENGNKIEKLYKVIKVQDKIVSIEELDGAPVEPKG